MSKLNLPSRSLSVSPHVHIQTSLDDMIRVALDPRKRKNDSKEVQSESDVIEAFQCTIELLFQCTQFQRYISNTFYPKYTKITRCLNNDKHGENLIIEHNEILPILHGFCDDTSLEEFLCKQNIFKLDECSKCPICISNSDNLVDNKPYLEVRHMLTCPSSILVMLFFLFM